MENKKDTVSFGELYQDIITHIQKKDAFSSQAERQAAFNNSGLIEPLSTLINKVANYAFKVTDSDISAVKKSGISEDQIFELVICAAVGQASRQYTNALAALEQVITDKEGGTHAS
ncbi:MAG TPA: hypothetical protein VN721_03630 [Flavipsychrobacter sp.]|nr:hypothetical protein [Flavipsychrobacter sp.]